MISCPDCGFDQLKIKDRVKGEPLYQCYQCGYLFYDLTDLEIEWVDVKYSHKCYNCKRKIQYEHALNKHYEKEDLDLDCFIYTFPRRSVVIKRIKIAKKRHEARNQFNRWWREPIIQFLCCSCIASPFAELEYKTRERLGDGE